MMITRCGFCPACEKAGRPKTGNAFLIPNRGNCDYDFEIMKALRSPNFSRGITPHLYELIKSNGAMYLYRKICGMSAHTSIVVQEPDGLAFYLNENLWSPTLRITPKNWNALVMFKDTGFEII